MGLTAKEIASHFQVPLHSISGRITELKQVERVVKSDLRRDGSAVVVALNPNRDLFAGIPVEMNA